MAGGIESSWTWAIGFLTFAFGVACGLGVGYLLLGSSRRTEELQQKLNALQTEFDAYREQVSSHFLRTSELVQKMTDSYRDVYEHLATGSQALCQNPVSTPRLDIPEHPEARSKIQDRSTEQTATTGFSDAETNGYEVADEDSCLGDSPHVPSLDTEENTNAATPRTP